MKIATYSIFKRMMCCVDQAELRKTKFAFLIPFQSHQLRFLDPLAVV